MSGEIKLFSLRQTPPPPPISNAMNENPVSHSKPRPAPAPFAESGWAAGKDRTWEFWAKGPFKACLKGVSVTEAGGVGATFEGGEEAKGWCHYAVVLKRGEATYITNKGEGYELDLGEEGSDGGAWFEGEGEKESGARTHTLHIIAPFSYTIAPKTESYI